MLRLLNQSISGSDRSAISSSYIVGGETHVGENFSSVKFRILARFAFFAQLSSTFQSVRSLFLIDQENC